MKSPKRYCRTEGSDFEEIRGRIFPEVFIEDIEMIQFLTMSMGNSSKPPR